MLETALHRALDRLIRTGDLRVTYPSTRSETYGDAIGNPVAVRIADPGALRAVMRDPSLRTAEMYMDGRLVIERGDIYDFIALVKANGPPATATRGARLARHTRRLAGPVNRAVGLGRARANVAHHYDLDARLFRLFLDEDMQYSCAWFETPEMSLDQAQLAKKRLIAAKLLIRPGARVLDIGCGWGGMALYLAEVCGADVTGITLSEEQLAVATARAAERGLEGRVRFRLQDYRETAETFEHIVSVGMLEHVGLRQMPTYFAAAARLLAPDGIMVLHSMAQPKPARFNQPFIEKYIFPGGYIPALSQVVAPAEASGLRIRDVEILSLHYAQTCREWRRRFLAQRERVLELYDARFLRMWDFYLAGAEASFRYNGIHVFHMQLAHDQERIPLTRAYIAAEMQRLRRAEARLPAYAPLHAAPARPAAAE